MIIRTAKQTIEGIREHLKALDRTLTEPERAPTIAYIREAQECLGEALTKLKEASLLAILGLFIVFPAHAFDTRENPDRVPSFGIDLWKGQQAGLDRQTVETTGGLVGGLFDYRQPVTNALTLHAFAQSEGIDNNLRYSSGYRVGFGMRVYLQER